MARAATIRSGRESEGQLTISGFLENLSRKAEVQNPLRPATRLFCVVLSLSALGLVIQASHAATTASEAGFRAEVFDQVLFRVLGIVVLLIGFRIGPRGLRPFLPHLTVVTGVLLILCFVEPFGIVRNGSRRWVDLGIAFQPSELARLVVVMWIADRCVRLDHLVYSLRKGVFPMLSLVLTFVGLVLIETDLGGALLILLCALSTMWVGGARLKQVTASLVTVGGGAIVAMSTAVPYVRERIQVFLGESQNDQVSDSLAALASGHVSGAGLSHGGFRNEGVPYLESDYVFALVGEELGLLGLLLVLGLYCGFLWFALRLVLSLRDRYETLASFGLLVSVAMQAMIHLQVVSGLAPPKGMTLPFLSAGGTSLIVSSLAVGLALGAARRTHEELFPCIPSNATASSH